jgi:hypothetical protein
MVAQLAQLRRSLQDLKIPTDTEEVPRTRSFTFGQWSESLPEEPVCPCCGAPGGVWPGVNQPERLVFDFSCGSEADAEICEWANR